MLQTGPFHHRPGRAYVSGPLQLVPYFGAGRRTFWLLNVCYLLLGIVSITVEVFLRFLPGERYINMINFVAGLWVLSIFLFFAGPWQVLLDNVEMITQSVDRATSSPWAFWGAARGQQAVFSNPFEDMFSERALRKSGHMFTVMKAYAIAGILHQCVNLGLRWYRVTPHVGGQQRLTTYQGRPLLLLTRQVPEWIERFVNQWLEPLFLLFLSHLIGPSEPFVAAWLATGAIALSLHSHVRHFMNRQMELDAYDSMIESLHMQQRMRSFFVSKGLEGPDIAMAPAYHPHWPEQGWWAPSAPSDLRPSFIPPDASANTAKGSKTPPNFDPGQYAPGKDDNLDD